MLTTASVARVALRSLLFLLLANCVAAQGKMVASRVRRKQRYVASGLRYGLCAIQFSFQSNQSTVRLCKVLY